MVVPAPRCLADRYELRQLLGRGGMGEVYDAWDRRLERPVAVKLLRSTMAADRGALSRFNTEARAAARLVHPKVVGVFDTGEHDGSPFIVMERLPGRTLADEMAGGPLSTKRVRAVLIDMLEALDFAHRNGVIHRDIKPSNVLLTADGTGKIADFGIAKFGKANLTQTGQFVGTASYLSPERLNGSPASPQSDLYSVGIVGYEALLGRKPFQADTPLGLVRAIAQDPIPGVREQLPQIDRDLAEAIDTATRRNPEDRHSSARQMLAAMKAAGYSDTAPSVAGKTPGLLPPESATPTPAGDGAESLPATEVHARPTSQMHVPWYRRRLALLIGLSVLALAILFLPRPPFGSDGHDPAPSPLPGETLPEQPGDPPGGSESQALAGVRAVEFLGPGTLIIEQTGSGEPMTIEAPQAILPLIRAEVAGEMLTIGLPPGSVSGQIGTIVYRIRLEQLRELTATGSGRIRVSGISGESLTMYSAGSASTEISGTVESLRLTLDGSGSFEGSRLQAGQVTAELSGSGGAVVAVSDSLQADLSGSGSLEYIGNPRVVQNAAGSGRIEKAG